MSSRRAPDVIKGLDAAADEGRSDAAWVYIRAGIDAAKVKSERA